MDPVTDLFAVFYIVVGLVAAAVWIVCEGALLIMDLLRRR